MESARPSPLLVVRSILRIAIVNGLMTWALFWAAGTTAWPEAWWCMGLLFLGLAGSVLVLWHANPELIVARRGFGEGTKPWDFVMVAILITGTAVLVWVAGFDQRYDWTPLPGWPGHKASTGISSLPCASSTTVPIGSSIAGPMPLCDTPATWRGQ